MVLAVDKQIKLDWINIVLFVQEFVMNLVINGHCVMLKEKTSLKAQERRFWNLLLIKLMNFPSLFIEGYLIVQIFLLLKQDTILLVGKGLIFHQSYLHLDLPEGDQLNLFRQTISTSYVIVLRKSVKCTLHMNYLNK